MYLVERQYSGDPDARSAWWINLNIALATAYRMRAVCLKGRPEDHQRAWLHFKNALGAVPDILWREADILSIQAMLGMTLFLQGTSNPQPTLFLISAAMRFCQSLGLHRRDPCLDAVEAEQRRRVFWVAYCLEKDTCLRYGQPSLHNDDDMDIELPSSEPSDHLGTVLCTDGKSRFNFFRVLCQFSSISSKIYRQLYSTGATKKSIEELVDSVEELHSELEAWKRLIPVDVLASEDRMSSYRYVSLSILILHFAYYNSVCTIHRAPAVDGPWMDAFSKGTQAKFNRSLESRILSSVDTRLSAARAMIHLTTQIPRDDFGCIWLLLHHPVSALTTVFAKIVENPRHELAWEDLWLMESVVTFLSSVADPEDNDSLKFVLSLCSNLRDIGMTLIQRSELNGR